MKNPYVAGNWVRGERFFGRAALLEEILQGERVAIWVAGTRRLGKTSLLKQLEYLCGSESPAADYISLFWDLQGAGDLAGLKESLVESIEDNEELFSNIGVLIEDVEKLDLFDILRSLKRSARRAGKKLLLLCDECEELINIEKADPKSIPKLRRALQSGESIKTVFMATKRLLRLGSSSQTETSPFLHGLIPPLYLGPLDASSAEELLVNGNISSKTGALVVEKTGRHPFLMQLMCRRLFEEPDIEKVIAEMSNDVMLDSFFRVDFNFLDDIEKTILSYVLENQDTTVERLQEQSRFRQENISQRLHGLINLGYLRLENDCVSIVNYFFHNWLQREKDLLFEGLRVDEQSVSSSNGHESAAAEQLVHYKSLELLGTGGMGKVYRAFDERLEREVALKCMLEEAAKDKEFRERFLIEARAASALNHPNIATVYAIENDAGSPFISMELVDGVSLSDWYAQSKPDLATKLFVMSQMAAAVYAAHSNDIVHRDLKPENILVSEDNQVKVMDFGLAKMMSRDRVMLTQTGTTLGTLAYMSPEQVSGVSVDNRSDIFSLGIVFYELLAECGPYRAENEAALVLAILQQQMPSFNDLNIDLSDELGALLDSMLIRDLGSRCQQLTEICELLGSLFSRQTS